MSPSPTHAVLLLHTRPGLPHHTDLLLERPPASPAHAANPDDRRLIAFRLDGPRPDLAALDQPATRTPDHRAHYLTHEGPIAADRGAVSRILTALILHLHETPTAVRATLKTDSARLNLEAHHLQNDRWRLQTRPA